MIAAIDPGLKGGLVFNYGPTSTHYAFSGWDVYDIYDLLKDHSPECVFIEDVALITPNKKIVADLAGEVGIYKGYCIALSIPFTMVLPKVWQSYLGLERCTDKKLKKGYCQGVESAAAWKRRLLEFALTFDSGLTLETCDAYLISKYALSILTHTLPESLF